MSTAVAIQCDIVVEELGSDMCTVRRRISLKNSKLAAVRDDLKQIVLRVTPLEEARSCKMVIKSFGYPVLEMNLFKRFVSQGKATISLTVNRVNIMLSNCPPDRLRIFLAILRTKLKVNQCKRLSLPPDAPPTSVSLLEEISPLRIIQQNKALGASMKTKFGAGIKQRTSTPIRVSTPILKTKKLAKPERTFSHVLGSWNSANGQVTASSNLQTKVIDLVKQGGNVFCTGGAGTGKSYLIRKIIGLLPPDCTAVTASTGTAANLIGGTTVHAFSGIGGLLEADVDNHLVTKRDEDDLSAWLVRIRDKLANSPSITYRWRQVQYLIIDEVSMLSCRLFSRLDLLAREARQPAHVEGKSFGGLQVIVFGDFFQLPPVSNNPGSARFAFESPSWASCRFNSVELLHSWRQSDDLQLARLLSAVREGQCPPWAERLLKSRCLSTSDNNTGSCGDACSSALLPTRLCTHRSDTETHNVKMLAALPGESKNYTALDNGPSSSLLDTICPAPKSLSLKVGAQVMLLRNIDTTRGLVNGARGVIEHLNGNGMGLPQVRFFIPGSRGGLLYVVQRQKWCMVSPGTLASQTTNSNISRTQLPLNLAWAISIHKSQGITLDSAELALAKAFECGQAYVALSRCRTLNSLRLLDWRPQVVRADSRVVQFYEYLRQKQRERCKSPDNCDLFIDDSCPSPIKRVQ